LRWTDRPVVWATEAEFELQERLNKLPFYAPAGFGGVIEDIQSLIAKAPALLSQANTILAKAGPFLPFILSIVEDPALPLIITRVKTLQTVHAATAAPAAPGATPSGPPKGVDLHRAVPLLDAAIWYEKHKWVPWAVGAGVVLTLGGIGFGIGRLSKRCRAPSGVGRHYRRR
jgi:hypothetical protein